jgi:hypothetical protein
MKTWELNGFGLESLVQLAALAREGFWLLRNAGHISSPKLEQDLTAAI